MQIWYTALAFFFIMLNSFFVAAEFAMVKLRHTQIIVLAKETAITGRIITNIHKHLDAYLSACQVGVTLASLGLGWIGEPAFAHIIEPVLKYFGLYNEESIKFISLMLAFATITLLHIVIGELMPKSVAIQKPEQISKITAIPLFVFYWCMCPMIWLLNISSNTLLKLFNLKVVKGVDSIYSTEEIKLILDSSKQMGELTKDEAEIMTHTLDFADLRITEIMRPADELKTIQINATKNEAIKTILATRFSRYPVVDKNQIVGFVHVKDIFAKSIEENNLFDLKKLLRPTINVQSNVPALEILRLFRKIGTHFAIIYRKKELIGFVTLDNMLHIIIGRIKDEFHKTENDWVKNSDGSISVAGDCSIYAIEIALGIEIEENEKYFIDNISELILHRLGHYPEINIITDLNDFKIKITKQNSINEIEELIIYPNETNNF